MSGAEATVKQGSAETSWQRPPVAADTLSIGALSRATRVPVETLRTWERRYGWPIPARRRSGHRRYAAESVEQVRRVLRLLAQGHRAGEILGLSARDLDALLAVGPPGSESRRAGKVEPALAAEPADQAIADMLEAAVHLEREAILRELRAGWSRLGPLRFLEELAGPFMAEVGRTWQKGILEVRHEHFASACLADFLREAREPYDQQARGPRVAAATLPGDAHEGGLRMVCALLSVRGYRVIYLGADTPVEEIAATAKSGAEAVALSISLAVRRSRSAKAVTRLRELLPPRTRLWVGGSGAPRPLAGVERFESLTTLDAQLAAKP